MSALRSSIEGHIGAKKQPDGHDGTSLDDRLEREKQSLALKFLTVSLDASNRNEGQPDLYWEHLYSGFEDITDDLIQMRKESLTEIDSLRSRLKTLEDPASNNEDKGVQDDDTKKLRSENEQLREGMKRLEENIETKAKAVTELQHKFDALEQEYLVLYKESVANNP